MSHRPFDIMVPLGPNDRDLAELCVRAARRNLPGARNIYVVARDDPGLDDTIFIAESHFPFSLEDVAGRSGVGDRSSWYLQQLLKLYFPFVVGEALDEVMVIDADTLFLRPVNVFVLDRPAFNFGEEFHAPYFDHIARLLPTLVRMTAYSGICHCMLFNRVWTAEILVSIERRYQRPFWQAFLDLLDPAQKDSSGASEYELYFHYCLGFHSREIVIRALAWKNVATVEEIDPAAFDYVSIHWHERARLDLQALTARVLGA